MGLRHRRVRVSPLGRGAMKMGGGLGVLRPWGLYSLRPSCTSQWPVFTCGSCAWWQCPVGCWWVQWPASWGLDGLQGSPLRVPSTCPGREHWGDRERVAGRR